MYKQIVTKVVEILFEDHDIQQLVTERGIGRAIVYKRLTCSVQVNDLVLLNVTATELNLGTGGWDIVVAKMSEHGDCKLGDDLGHIMKARYTPIQHSVLSVESQESEYHEQLKKPASLSGKPVWLAELHSMVPVFYYISQEMIENSRCCVIFDDQAALPLMMSEHFRTLQNEESFHSITVGQAFGGEYEAVTIASALQFAHSILKADFILISVGPGVVGTGTGYGFTGMTMSHWSHTISAMGGSPIWIPRMSFADKRKRHYGISHHTLTPLCQFTFKPALLPLPYLVGEKRNRVEEQIQEQQPFQTEHQISFSTNEQTEQLCKKALQRAKRPIRTMGRNYEDDPIFFLAIAESLNTGFSLLG